MICKSIRYRDFRNLSDVRAEFSPGMNVLWGENAQGKSNILEGIYYFARGRSFRGAKDRELINFGAPSAEGFIVYKCDERKSTSELTFLIPSEGKKQFTAQGAAVSSSREMIGRFRAVLFCPSHLELVGGSPSVRRNFLDIALSQLSSRYLLELSRYNRLLRQRNALIKNSRIRKVSDAEWESIAILMASSGAYLSSVRGEYIKRAAFFVKECFTDMMSGAETPALIYATQAKGDGGCESGKSISAAAEDAYNDKRAAESEKIDCQAYHGSTYVNDKINSEASSDFYMKGHMDIIGAENICSAKLADACSEKTIRPTEWIFNPARDKGCEETLYRILTENIEREMRYGASQYGIQKDDIKIKLNGRDARLYASQGQQRSLALSLKLAEGEISKDVSGEYPVFLLDDVLSELDGGRRSYVLERLRGRQIIATSCEPEMYYGEELRFLTVSGGRVFEK